MAEISEVHIYATNNSTLQLVSFKIDGNNYNV